MGFLSFIQRFMRDQSGAIANLKLHFGTGYGIIRGMRQSNRYYFNLILLNFKIELERISPTHPRAYYYLNYYFRIMIGLVITSNCETICAR